MKIALLVAGALADVFDESLDDHWHSGLPSREKPRVTLLFLFREELMPKF